MTASCDLPGGSLRIPIAAFPDPALDEPLRPGAPPERAILAGGCFWCVEAVYREIPGVLEVIPGYAGGHATTANYAAVCTGTTGHAEAVELRYDPARVSWGHLLKVFFSVAHDPTQLDCQGNDHGPQYRSAVFPTSSGQRRVAEAYLRQLSDAGIFVRPIVTRIEGPAEFFPAERYHYNYAALHPAQPYIAAVAAPKAAKARDHFGGREGAIR